MEQFCKDVIDFLESEYADAYQFELIAHQEINSIKHIELKIRIGSCYTKIIGNASMEFVYRKYVNGTYLENRKQYRWQKELIDMIEGS